MHVQRPWLYFTLTSGGCVTPENTTGLGDKSLPDATGEGRTDTVDVVACVRRVQSQ